MAVVYGESEEGCETGDVIVVGARHVESHIQESKDHRVCVGELQVIAAISVI